MPGRGDTAQRPPNDDGSAVVEFVLVGALLTLVTLSVLQFALALHVRNTVLDAASEGARFAALADSGLDEGATRTEDLIAGALGGDYPVDVTAARGDYLGHPAVVVDVTASLPVIGLIGLPGSLEVSGHAALEAIEG
ncbi:TadE family protein [Marisediminicola sp. LYQ134]|uniref:TadE family protein n=1 Tax=unclassified Marisediminicola TaxID=2618316 RepID=UPI003983C1B8